MPISSLCQHNFVWILTAFSSLHSVFFRWLRVSSKCYLCHSYQVISKRQLLPYSARYSLKSLAYFFWPSDFIFPSWTPSSLCPYCFKLLDSTGILRFRPLPQRKAYSIYGLLLYWGFSLSLDYCPIFSTSSGHLGLSIIPRIQEGWHRVGQEQVSTNIPAVPTLSGMGAEWMHKHPWFIWRPGSRKTIKGHIVFSLSTLQTLYCPKRKTGISLTLRFQRLHPLRGSI
jgi:hypothetical protein